MFWAVLRRKKRERGGREIRTLILKTCKRLSFLIESLQDSAPSENFDHKLVKA